MLFRSVALANLTAVPLLIVFLSSREKQGQERADTESGSRKRIVRQRIGREEAVTVLSAAVPYIAVAALLMWYNAARFGSPFEFGQAYQLTVADLHSYGSVRDTFSLSWELRGLYENFFGFDGFSETFPFIRYGGAFVNFPMLLLVCAVFIPVVRKRLAQRKLYGLSLVLFFLPVLITLIDALWSPILYERYRMDIYYLMGILTYLVSCCILLTEDERKRIRAERILSALCVLTIISSILLYFVPYDYNASAWFSWFTR